MTWIIPRTVDSLLVPNKHERFNGIFEDMSRLLGEQILYPATKYEKKDLRWQINMPGAKKEEVSVEFEPENSMLTISAKIARTGRTIKESHFIANHLDADSIKASLEDGILTIDIPKLLTPKTETRKIEIT